MYPTIRPERPDDHEHVCQIHRLAFARDDESDLVESLREGGHVRVSLVACEGEEPPIGHILFVEMAIVSDDAAVPALALAPVAVIPDRQRLGIGSALIRAGLDACRRQGHRIVLVLGHPEYYPRFGFSAALARPIGSPFPPDAFMALELAPDALRGVTGAVRYPTPFGLRD